MDILRNGLCAALLFFAGKSAGMEEPESDEMATYDSKLWDIHGQSILLDSGVLQCGLESLQIQPQNLFEQKIPHDVDRQVLYSFYALSKRLSYERALKKQKFNEIASLARSFYLLRHQQDIRPYFAANVFSATSTQIDDYCRFKTDADEATVTAFLTHPQCMYQRAPYTTPTIEKLAITHCGKNPLVIELALWSINPHDDQELWCMPLITEGTAAIKKLAQSIAALCGSKKDLFAATSSGAIIRPYYDNQKILCDEIVVCDHPITHIAATEFGKYIIAGNSNYFSIIKITNGSYITHKITQFPLQSVGICDVANGYWGVAVGVPPDEVKKNLLAYVSICPEEEPCLIKKELTLAKDSPKNCTVGADNMLHCAFTTKSNKWALASIRADMIPGLSFIKKCACHIPNSGLQKLERTSTNSIGTLSIACIWREKTKKSWAIWDHITDEIHELPDIDYHAVIPEGVSSQGDISILAGNEAGYARITIHARPHLSFVKDPKSSFKSKLFLLAAVGAQCIEGILSIEDDPHWKSSFNELPNDLQETLVAHYPVYTKSLLSGTGKSIIK